MAAGATGCDGASDVNPCIVPGTGAGCLEGTGSALDRMPTPPASLFRTYPEREVVIDALAKINEELESPYGDDDPKRGLIESARV